jgi:hypothetical protein
MEWIRRKLQIKMTVSIAFRIVFWRRCEEEYFFCLALGFKTEVEVIELMHCTKSLNNGYPTETTKHLPAYPAIEHSSS